MKIFCRGLFFVLLIAGKVFSQDTSSIFYSIDSLPVQGILLDKGWKFHPGDDPAWANPEFDDSNWEDINPTLEIFYLPQIRKEPVGWFRIHLHIDSNMLNTPLAIQIYQSSASEIYMDGKLVKQYGIVSKIEADIKAFQPNNEPIGLQFSKNEYVIAVRFSIKNGLPYFRHVIPNFIFQLRINDVGNAVKFKDLGKNIHLIEIFEAGLFLIISLIHLGFFFSFKKEKANLYFSISTFSYGMAHLLYIILINSHSISFRVYAAAIQFSLMLSIYSLFLLMAIWQLFIGKRNIWFWLIVLNSGLGIFISLYFYEWGWFWGFMVPLLICMLASMLITFNAWRRGHRGVEILLIGILLYFMSFSIFTLIYSGIIPNPPIVYEFDLASFTYHFSVICLPISLSIYLAREFAFTSKELEKKLTQVQDLSEKAIAQELEKQQILTSQNEMLEQQVTERTSELNHSLHNLKATQAQLIQSEKMASLGELTAGIAHEIQNPLNFVNNFSEVSAELMEEARGKRQKAKENSPEVTELLDDIGMNLEKINHHGKRADAIVKGMLQHSRSSTGNKEPTDINALVSEYVKLAFHGYRGKDSSFETKLVTHFDPAVGQLNIAPNEIGRVILNLLNNAFYSVTERRKMEPQFSPEVEISTAAKSRGIEITVRDNGNGIPQKIADKIFQPFFTTKPTGQGTGLGLSLAYDIIKSHGGEIKVNNIEGEGAEFSIILHINS